MIEGENANCQSVSQLVNPSQWKEGTKEGMQWLK